VTAYNGRVAMPGDSDLDCHLTGLRLQSVVVMPTDDYDAEVTLAYDTTGAAGWWTDRETGETVFPDRVTSLENCFGLVMESGFTHVLDAMIARLEAWSADGSLLAMTCAPRKWTLLHCPGHPAGTQVVIPRVVIPRADAMDKTPSF